MEKALAYMWNHNEPNNDVVIMLHNYANLMSDLGEPLKAINAMKKCAEMIKEVHTDKCLDYADLYFDMGIIYLQMRDAEASLLALRKAFRVYREILSESEITEKFSVLPEFCKPKISEIITKNAELPV